MEFLMPPQTSFLLITNFIMIDIIKFKYLFDRQYIINLTIHNLNGAEGFRTQHTKGVLVVRTIL
jgi:hypothetical protein